MSNLLSSWLAPLNLAFDIQTQWMVNELKVDSRAVESGDVFIALPSDDNQRHGLNYVDQAITQGASVVICDQQDISLINKALMIPIIPIPNLQQKLPELLARFYPLNQQESQIIVAVTGTNGKTSTVHFIYHLLKQLGVPTATIGTLGIYWQDQWKNTTNTTNNLVDNFRICYHLQQQGCQVIALEASSHGLSTGRLQGLPITGAIFTNITHDHLDHHGSLTAYQQSKQRLLKDFALKVIITDGDDPVLNYWLKEGIFPTYTQVLSATKNSYEQYKTHHYQLTQQSTELTQFQYHSLNDQVDLHWPLLGQIQIQNLCYSLMLLQGFGFSLALMNSHVSDLPAVQGRMESFNLGQSLIIIDYAHTPDALDKALLSLRDLNQQRLVCVFGCGGNRDKAKRSQMGKIAERLADEIYLTSDNPRYESPQEIINNIREGMSGNKPCHIILDRKQAVQKALQQAQAGDIILLAGMGHEKVQQIAGEQYAYSERMWVTQLLSEQQITQESREQVIQGGVQ